MKKLATTMIGFFTLAVTGSALAGSTIRTGYAGKAGGPVGDVLGKVHRSGTLPFTGLNLAIFAALALLLIGLGILMNRATRRSTDEN